MSSDAYIPVSDEERAELQRLVREGLATSNIVKGDDDVGYDCFFCRGAYWPEEPDFIVHEPDCLITRARILTTRFEQRRRDQDETV